MVDNPYKPNDTWSEQEGNNSNKQKTGVFRKILTVLGVFMLLIILLFAYIGVKTTRTYNKLEGKAEPLITKVLQEESPTWNYDTLKPHLSGLWIREVKEEQSKKLMKMYDKLGKLKSINTINWTGCVSNTTTQYGTIDRCNYVANVDYENGAANVLVGVVIENNAPKIIQLHINSDVFLNL